ncbi:MAG: hypothetical protein KA795_04770 [Burkholderiaceae bacterium]|nr:hypothetical protein [Burkholderiaceae bacterium]
MGGETRAPMLYDAAHARTGDKGDICNIALVARDARFYPLLAEQVTEAAVAAHFGHRRPRAVRRYLLPGLNAMNFVLEGALDGGVNNALNLDTHGKSLAFLLLSLPLDVPPGLRAMLAPATVSPLPQPFHVPHDRSLP